MWYTIILIASSKVKGISLSEIFDCFTISFVFIDRIISNYFTIINFKQMNELKKYILLMMLSAVRNSFINTGRTFNQPYDSNNI